MNSTLQSLERELTEILNRTHEIQLMYSSMKQIVFQVYNNKPKMQVLKGGKFKRKLN